MAPIATDTSPAEQTHQVNKPVVEDSIAKIASTASLAPAIKKESLVAEPDYEWDDYKPSFPIVNEKPLEPIAVTDRGHSAPSLGKNKKENTVLAKASKYKFITPALGVEVEGVQLKDLTDSEKADLALLAAQVGVVVVRDNASSTFSVRDHIEFGRHFGPLHVHQISGVPRIGGLDEALVLYNDQHSIPDPTAVAKEDFYHSDITYELQPPGLTSLRLLTQPEVGGDTLFISGAAIYASFSPAFQAYLETLSAVNTGIPQSNAAKARGQHVRRDAVETVHPVVRVHPVTGIKSIFVNAVFTSRIVGVPKPESDAILGFLNRQFVVNADFQARVRWQPGTLVLWDNRVVNHSALFDFYPERRHGVRVTPQAEKPLSVAEYEKEYKKEAKNWAVERAKELGVKLPATKTDDGAVKERGFKD